MNRVHLIGEALNNPVFDHEAHGRRYYKITIRTMRRSGAADDIPVIMDGYKDCKGRRLEIEGRFRSYNKREEGRTRLLLYIQCLEVKETALEDDNEVTIDGTVTKEPIFRHTPLGRVITDMLIAANRSGAKADYIPCITFGTLARRAEGYNIGVRLRVRGRFQSRAYEKDGETRTAYELCAKEIEQV